MLAKRPAPVIGKFPNSIMSAGKWDSSTTPRTPSEFKILSPRGLINTDLRGVGLGIVAAMENHFDGYKQFPANTRNSTRSNPIPVNCTRKSVPRTEEEDSLEDYTFVTGIGPGNKSFTRVYCDADFEHRKKGDRQRIDLDWKRSKRNNNNNHNNNNNNNPSMFAVSPARFGEFSAYPPADFLSSCHLCHKKLQGKDIYMYRGEKAFCSTECRYNQIVMDEKKEKCSSELGPRSVEIFSSPYQNGQIFSPGILAI